jgi:hypothetical protein
MNLAEFPIALLADRVPKGQKTLYFEDQHGRLTVTGSDAYGLPTATDTDVIVALIYLTKLRSEFKDVKVNFSRYELIKLLNWSDEAWYYKRLEQSFNRWSGVLLVYDKCWWNNRLKCYTSAKMHIVETVEIIDRDARRRAHRDGRTGLTLSCFTWNREFIESCQADNLRQLDLETYFSLKSAVSKRLYRFLGKRFYRDRDWTFDLNEIAFDRVGLSRSYADAGKIKEKLQPAIEELEAIGFLRPLSREDRYQRIDRGQWTIRLVRKSSTPLAVAEPSRAAEDRPAEPELPPLIAELISRGVTPKTAAELVEQKSAADIAVRLDVFDWLMEAKDKRIERSPAGYLVESIRGEYATPKGFVPKAERQRRAEARQAQERAKAEQRRRQQEQEAHERALREEVDAYLKQLTPSERKALEAEALARAGPEVRQGYEEAAPARLRASMLLGLVREHLAKELRREAIYAEA